MTEDNHDVRAVNWAQAAFFSQLFDLQYEKRLKKRLIWLKKFCEGPIFGPPWVFKNRRETQMNARLGNICFKLVGRSHPENLISIPLRTWFS